MKTVLRSIGRLVEIALAIVAGVTAYIMAAYFISHYLC